MVMKGKGAVESVHRALGGIEVLVPDGRGWRLAGEAASAESYRGVLECDVIAPPPTIDPETRSLAEPSPPPARSRAVEPCSTARASARSATALDW